MSRETKLLQRQVQQQQAQQRQIEAAIPKRPSRKPNPEEYPLKLYDTRSRTVPGKIDARDALWRLVRATPMWVRSLLALRLAITTRLKWHSKPDLTNELQFDLRPGAKVHNWEMSSVCRADKAISFIEEGPLYIEYEVRCEPLGTEETKVTLETRVHPKSLGGKLHLPLVRPFHNAIFQALMPGLDTPDPALPSFFVDEPRPGFRQPKTKHLAAQVRKQLKKR